MGSEYEESELNEVMDDLDELIKKEVLFAPMDPEPNSDFFQCHVQLMHVL